MYNTCRLKTCPCHTYVPSNFFVYILNCMGVWYPHIHGSSVFPGQRTIFFIGIYLQAKVLGKLLNCFYHSCLTAFTRDKFLFFTVYAMANCLFYLNGKSSFLKTLLELPVSTFVSRFESYFNVIGFLGHGAFGVVIKAIKQDRRK